MGGAEPSLPSGARGGVQMVGEGVLLECLDNAVRFGAPGPVLEVEDIRKLAAR